MDDDHQKASFKELRHLHQRIHVTLPMQMVSMMGLGFAGVALQITQPEFAKQADPALRDQMRKPHVNLIAGLQAQQRRQPGNDTLLYPTTLYRNSIATSPVSQTLSIKHEIIAETAEVSSIDQGERDQASPWLVGGLLVLGLSLGLARLPSNLRLYDKRAKILKDLRNQGIAIAQPYGPKEIATASTQNKVQPPQNQIK